MLHQNIIHYLEGKNAWYPDESREERQVLADLSLDLNSDVAYFYLHASDGPTFYSRGREIYHLPWFLLNTKLAQNLYILNETLGLSEDYLPLDHFEGENGFFYQKTTGRVYHIEISGKTVQEWADFSDFLRWYFQV